jgi:hypothetical protein
MPTEFGTILSFLLLAGILFLGLIAVGRLLRPSQSAPADETGVVEERGAELTEQHFPLIPAILVPVLALVLLTPLAAVIGEVGVRVLLPGAVVILLPAAGLYHLRLKGDLDRMRLRQVPTVLGAAFRYERAWFAGRREIVGDRA